MHVLLKEGLVLSELENTCRSHSLESLYTSANGEGWGKLQEAGIFLPSLSHVQQSTAKIQLSDNKGEGREGETHSLHGSSFRRPDQP